MRTRETDIEVFDGEVESLSTAGIQGVGVRVVVDRRQGYAWAGSLEPDVVDETLSEARDNAAFGEPDEWNALATPADVAGVRAGRISTCGATSCSRLPHRRQGAHRARARGRDQRRRPTRPRRRGDGLRRRAAESAIANSLGVESYTPSHDVLGARGRDGRRRSGRRPDTASPPAVRSPTSTSMRSHAMPSTERCACSARSR